MISITVCVGSTCYLKGSYNIINQLIKMVEDNNLENEVVVKGACCLGNCGKPVSIKVNDGSVLSVNESNIKTFFEEEILKKLRT
ncbi:(2Fe-2S) ferredoxin domain-containing protein [Clostridium aestuarii]|uniref:(2Fe-2S) ferredoxin domain-containing protein n=1 Tax=Clostridium aestuarii TaxID=338193 RepID=A0ABT4CZS9_9CLOT|nr:(2Fe-2S) ferredoxin domain-containing protein [Clostridium aestuarii]